MRRVLVAVSLLALAAACGGTPTADVSIEWTFGGQSCSAAGVSKITLDFGGFALSRNSFDCALYANGVDLGYFAAGSYEVVITGYDANDNPIYLSDSVVDVAGQKALLFTIDSAAQLGEVNLTWTFGGQSCSDAGVKIVSVYIDGQPLTDASGDSELACTQNGVDGINVSSIFAGTHSFEIFAQSGSAAYAKNFQVLVQAGATQVTPVNLAQQNAAASALVSWTFSNTLDCSAVGVDTIDVVMDPQASGAGGTVVGTTTCLDSKGSASLEIFDIPDGTHTFGVRGIANGTLTYYTHSPVQSVFAAPSETDVTVDAEPTP